MVYTVPSKAHPHRSSISVDTGALECGRAFTAALMFLPLLSRHRVTLSRRSARCWCCNRSTAATWWSTSSRQFSCRVGPADPAAGERRAGRRGSNGVCRRARSGGRRLHPVDLRRCPKPDLIVTMAGPAAVFARRYRRLLFPDTPLLFAAVDQRWLADAPLGENETAVAVVNDFPRVLEDILHVLPQTRQVFMVMGSGPVRPVLATASSRSSSPISRSADICLARRSILPEMLHRTASLPDNSAIFYLTFGTDAAGAAYADERVFADLHATANAPVLAAHIVYLGAGVVGGSLMSIDDLSRRTADVAVRLLNGAAPNSIRRAVTAHGATDLRLARAAAMGHPRESAAARERRALSPSEPVARIPGHGVERGRRGARPIALIVGLLYQRRARQRAEIDSRRNLALAADASRRQTMSALTSSIAHEVGQPLSAMIHNAQALQVMVAANRATTDMIGEILSDIQTQGVQATRDHRSPSDDAAKPSDGH